MRDQVNLYLDRARRAATAKALGSATEVEPVLQALARTLQRINRDRAIAIEVSSVPNLRFRGEKQDLEEMLGNLMENACKWASTSVSVRALSKQVDGRQRLLITIDDDGPGIPLEKRHLALKRGQRLDESKPGSGLGLHIVTETAGMYGGNLELADSPTGGLSCSLNLPAI
jgi:signal transduction histidine kinase